VKKPPRPSHPYLTQAERQQLDILVRRGARVLRPEECNLLLSLAQRHFADLQHARAVAGGLRQEVNRLRADLRASEDELQERRGATTGVTATLPTEQGNAEDCPQCGERRDLPYPFLCPGHPAKAAP
jgi:hypothetical protein